MKRPTQSLMLACQLSVALLVWTGGMVSVIGVAESSAQDLNGIFYPRSSEEFFQEGVERLEEEISRLQRRDDEGDRPIPDPVLDIDESIQNQQDTLEEGDRWLMNDTSDDSSPRDSESRGF